MHCSHGGVRDHAFTTLAIRATQLCVALIAIVEHRYSFDCAHPYPTVETVRTRSVSLTFSFAFWRACSCHTATNARTASAVKLFHCLKCRIETARKAETACSGV